MYSEIEFELQKLKVMHGIPLLFELNEEKNLETIQLEQLNFLSCNKITHGRVIGILANVLFYGVILTE